jgi:ABC-type lipoprotein release transport system permease subunit
MLSLNESEFAYLMSSSTKFNRITLAFSFAAIAAVLVLTFSSGAIDSFAQTDLTTATSVEGEQEAVSTTTTTTTNNNNASNAVLGMCS